jgi:prepilin-type N-terminal cleavage/methylation domain-containing protein
METDLKTATARLRDLLGADRGFTLLETLAVMVIVGLLAAITVPQIAQWRAKAYLTSTTTDAKNFANGFYAATAETGVAPSGGDAAYAEVLASTKLSKGTPSWDTAVTTTSSRSSSRTRTDRTPATTSHTAESAPKA